MWILSFTAYLDSVESRVGREEPGMQKGWEMMDEVCKHGVFLGLPCPKCTSELGEVKEFKIVGEVNYPDCDLGHCGWCGDGRITLFITNDGDYICSSCKTLVLGREIVER